MKIFSGLTLPLPLQAEFLRQKLTALRSVTCGHNAREMMEKSAPYRQRLHEVEKQLELFAPSLPFTGKEGQ